MQAEGNVPLSYAMRLGELKKYKNDVSQNSVNLPHCMHHIIHVKAEAIFHEKIDVVISYCRSRRHRHLIIGVTPSSVTPPRKC